MLKFSRKNKRLVIPAGINPNYGLDSSAMYNTSDATIVANDVIAGKIGYGADGKIVGTLDIEERVQESYQEGYEFGYDEGNNAGYILGESEGFDNGVNAQKAKLESITITENGSYNREDGWNSVVVNVPDLNGSYNEGVEAGYQLGYDEGFTSGEASKQPEIDNLNSIIETNNEDFANINQRLQNINGE